MKVTSEHHKAAEVLFEQGMNTPNVQIELKKLGLTHSQANSACKTARKHLGIHKSIRKELKAAKERAKRDANRQAEVKTRVDEDSV
ncbi:MAG TPA: hypothetical protein VMW36_02915 [Patescibacteria group bacterium]|nr:hypothetical protein [Patescibacteria group bacterium]